MSVIETRYHDSVNVLQGVFAESGSTIGASAPFDRPEWYQLLANTGLTPLIATAHTKNQSAAMALTQEGGRVTPLRNWYNFTWRAHAPSGESGDQLLEAIAGNLRHRAHRITLAPVPDEDGSATRLAQAFSNAGWRVEVSVCDSNHIAHVKGRTFEEYWKARSSILRSTVRRKAKSLSVRVHTEFSEAIWDQYQTVYAESWKPREGQPDMLRAFAKRESELGQLRLGLAENEGKTVSGQLWTIEAGVAYIHKLAYVEASRPLSAGTVLSAAMIEHAISQDGAKLIDFGLGDEPFKRQWMEDVRPRYQIDCLDMAQPRAWMDLARLALGRSQLDRVPTLARLPVAS
ncbi:MAG: GNAT family N-acetyltransferase [Pseudomonadota bacterium]